MLRSYIYGVLGCVFLLDVVCILLPKGRMGKTVENAFRLAAVSVLVLPLLSLPSKMLFPEGETGKENELLSSLQDLRTQALLSDLPFVSRWRVEGDTLFLTAERGFSEEIDASALKELLQKEIVFEYE